jgi:diacylglycerol kinase (ATP)
MTAAIIINPRSGAHGRHETTGADRRAMAERAVAALTAKDDRVSIQLTERRGHAADLTRTALAGGASLVVAWGGDGTVNEVAGPLIEDRAARGDHAAALGIVPSGSGDGLARSLGLPRAPDAALRVALQGTTRAIDAGYFGERHFLNIGGVGFDAAVADIFNRGTRRGGLRYLMHGLNLVRTFEPLPFSVDLPGTRHDGPCFLIAFGNGREYGNGAVLAPLADLSDGWLDYAMVGPGSLVRQVWRARRLAFRRMAAAEGVVRGRTQTARIVGDNMPCHVDGETYLMSGELLVTIRPRALSVRVI